MLEILLIRHGQTQWNKERRIMGHRPIPLNTLGREQALAVAEALFRTPLDRIYASPMLRAVQTAKVLKKGRRGVEVIQAPELSEIDYGSWVGRTFEEVRLERSFHQYHVAPSRVRVPGGEKMRDVHHRAVGFVEELRTRHPEGRIALVSHADVIKIILIHFLGLSLNELMKLRIDNGSVSLLWFNETRARVMAINCPASPGHLFEAGEKK